MTKLLLRYNPLSSSKAVFSPVAFMVSPPSYSISLFGFCSHYSARTFLSLVSDSLFAVLSFPSPAATHLFASLLWASVTKKLSWHPSPHLLLLYLSSLPNKRRNYPKSLTAILSYNSMVVPLLPTLQSLCFYCPARTYTWVSHRHFMDIRKRDARVRSQRCVQDVESSS